MNSHDVGRDRGGVEDALARVTATTLVLGIDSDRLFPIDGQHRIARGIRTTLDGDRAVVLTSDFGHDGFLIETHAVGAHVRRLLEPDSRRGVYHRPHLIRSFTVPLGNVPRKE